MRTRIREGFDGSLSRFCADGEMIPSLSETEDGDGLTMETTMIVMMTTMPRRRRKSDRHNSASRHSSVGVAFIMYAGGKWGIVIIAYVT